MKRQKDTLREEYPEALMKSGVRGKYTREALPRLKIIPDFLPRDGDLAIRKTGKPRTQIKRAPKRGLRRAK